MPAKKTVYKGKEYHGLPRFYEILDSLAELHSRKNHDYSGVNDPLKNLTHSEDLGIPAWKGVAVRLNDKMDRINGFARKGEFLVNDEGIIDTLMDMSVYAILAVILYERGAAQEKATKTKKVKA